MEEIKKTWKNIIDYEDYYMISDYGDIYSHRHKRVIKQRKNTRGYMIIDLYKDKKRKTCLISRLVGFNYLDKKDEKYTDIDHINQDVLDNCVTNLRWIDKSGNNRNRNIKNKTGYSGVGFSRKKFTSQIRINGKKTHLGTFETPQEAHIAYRNKYNEIMSIY